MVHCPEYCTHTHTHAILTMALHVKFWGYFLVIFMTVKPIDHVLCASMTSPAAGLQHHWQLRVCGLTSDLSVEDWAQYFESESQFQEVSKSLIGVCHLFYTLRHWLSLTWSNSMNVRSTPLTLFPLSLSCPFSLQINQYLTFLQPSPFQTRHSCTSLSHSLCFITWHRPSPILQYMFLSPP